MKWEYCELGVTANYSKRGRSNAHLSFWTSTGADRREIDSIESAAAMLGQQGWEMVSHVDMLARDEETGQLYPWKEVYMFKRQITA